jgi:hypothetical protein
MQRVVLLLTLLVSSLPAIPQQLAAVGSVQTAQANPSPPPAPPPQSPPPSVMLPTAGAVSFDGILLGTAFVVGTVWALAGNHGDDTSSSGTTTGTR